MALTDYNDSTAAMLRDLTPQPKGPFFNHSIIKESELVPPDSQRLIDATSEPHLQYLKLSSKKPEPLCAEPANNSATQPGRSFLI